MHLDSFGIHFDFVDEFYSNGKNQIIASGIIKMDNDLSFNDIGADWMDDDLMAECLQNEMDQNHSFSIENSQTPSMTQEEFFNRIQSDPSLKNQFYQMFMNQHVKPANVSNVYSPSTPSVPAQKNKKRKKNVFVEQACEEPVKLSLFTDKKLEEMKLNAKKSLSILKKHFVGRLIHLLDDPTIVGRIVYIGMCHKAQDIKSVVPKKWLKANEYDSYTQSLNVTGKRDSFLNVRIRFPINSSYIHDGFASAYSCMEKIHRSGIGYDTSRSREKLCFQSSKKGWIQVSRIFSNEVLSGLKIFQFDSLVPFHPRSDKSKQPNEYYVFPCNTQMIWGTDELPEKNWKAKGLKSQEEICSLCHEYNSDEEYPENESTTFNSTICKYDCQFQAVCKTLKTNAPKRMAPQRNHTEEKSKEKTGKRKLKKKNDEPPSVSMNTSTILDQFISNPLKNGKSKTLPSSHFVPTVQEEWMDLENLELDDLNPYCASFIYVTPTINQRMKQMNVSCLKDERIKSTVY